MNGTLSHKKRHLLRIIIPAYPALNIYSFIADKTTALGPLCVASAAQEVEGWDVEVIDENNLRRSGPVCSSGGADHEIIQRQRPADVVGFYGGLTSTIPRVYELAHFYQQKGIITIAGGQHFVDETIPEAMASGIDCIVLGEGEETIKELLSAIQGKNEFNSIRGLVYKENGNTLRTPDRRPIRNLDMLPLPAFSLLRYAKVELFPVGRVRGCGMNCEFCTVKGKPRYASPERFVQQISHLVESMSAKYFFIVDDLFGQNRTETLRLCTLLKEYQEQSGKRLDFTAQIRLDRAQDTEMLKAMKEAHINTVAIGFESPISDELSAMNKCLRPEDMLRLTQTFHRFGFFVHGMFIFGYPMKENGAFVMSVEERIKHFKQFIKKARIDTIQVLLAVPLPGTELRTRLSRQNRIYPLDCLGWEYYDGNFPLSEPDTPLTPESSQLAIRKIMGRFYHIKYLSMAFLNILSFPHLLFYFHHIKSGWKRWRRKSRNYFFRLSGWKIMRNWTCHLKKGTFSRHLQKAKLHLERI